MSAAKHNEGSKLKDNFGETRARTKRERKKEVQKGEIEQQIMGSTFEY